VVINGSQQQLLVRNSEMGGRSNGVWNQVSSGTVGAHLQSFLVPPHDAGVLDPAVGLLRGRPG